MNSFNQKTQIRITSLNGNFMKLDGGAMFGNAPKALWQKWITPDEFNKIDIGSRSLLIETKEHKILFETGPGAYLSPPMKKRFSVIDDDHILLQSLKKVGISHKDITHIILSHLHFDHAGGLLKSWQGDDKKLELLFPHAQFIAGQLNFERSGSPHVRDRASFISELNSLLLNSNRLVLKKGGDHVSLGEINIEFFESHGHTPGMLISCVRIHDLDIIFTADLIPGLPWVNLPITMGYDRNPELLIDEKSAILKRAYKDNAFLFYPHDSRFSASKINLDSKTKRYVPEKSVKKFQVILDS